MTPDPTIAICQREVRDELTRKGSRISESEVADIVQNTIERFFSYREGVKPTAFGPYIKKIAASKVAEHFRDKKRRKAGSLIFEPLASSYDESVYSSLEKSTEIFERVDGRIKALFPRGKVPRDVMAAYLHSNGNRAETARWLGKNMNYVDSNLHRYRDFANAAILMGDPSEHAAKLPPWANVNKVIIDYRTVLNVAGYQATVETMAANSARLLRETHSGPKDFERFFIHECAFVKFLQQCGSYEQALRRVNSLERMTFGVRLNHELGTDTAEAFRSVSVRLRHPHLGAMGCESDLIGASESFRGTHHRIRFLWRMSLDAVARNSSFAAKDLLAEYQDLAGNALIPSANIDMVRTLTFLHEGDPDSALEHSGNYLLKQTDLWKNRLEIPDPSIQGIVSGLLLDGFTRWSLSRKNGDLREELSKFIFDVGQFQLRVGVSMKADGVRDISEILETINPHWQADFEIKRLIRTRQKRGTHRDFDDLLKSYHKLVN